MKAYVGEPTGKLANFFKDLGIGACISPFTKQNIKRHSFWFLDNGAFTYWKKKQPFNEKAFYRLLEKAENKRPDFVILPDLVAQGLQSLKFSEYWLNRLENEGFKHTWALALQDGMKTEDIKSFIEGAPISVLFVGGTVKWKIRTGHEWVELAHSYGLICHIGRVGSMKRVIWARRIGADSIDSALPLFSKEKLDRFLRALTVPLQAELPLFNVRHP